MQLVFILEIMCGFFVYFTVYLWLFWLQFIVRNFIYLNVSLFFFMRMFFIMFYYCFTLAYSLYFHSTFLCHICIFSCKISALFRWYHCLNSLLVFHVSHSFFVITLEFLLTNFLIVSVKINLKFCMQKSFKTKIKCLISVV